MNDIRECPDCGQIMHISQMWPECENCIASNSLPTKDSRIDMNPLLYSEYIERAVRVWCRSENKNYEIQAGIACIIAKLLLALDICHGELTNTNSNAGTRSEIAVPVKLILDLCP